MLEKTNSSKQAYRFKVYDPKGSKLTSLCKGCVKSGKTLIDQLEPHAYGETGLERAGHVIDSPTKTT